MRYITYAFSLWENHGVGFEIIKKIWVNRCKYIIITWGFILNGLYEWFNRYIYILINHV